MGVDVEKLVKALRLHKAWSDSEKTGPDYGGQTRDTHPDGEKIWRIWWGNQLDLCDRATRATDEVLAPLCDQCLLDDEAVKHRALDQAWQRIYGLFEKPNSQSHDEVLFDVNHGERSAIHWALSEIEKLGGMDPQKRGKE